MILITGGAGFIGSNIANAFSKEEVVAFDNLFRGRIERLEKEVIYEKGDVRNFEDVFKVFERYSPDIVIHAAWINGTKYFYEMPYHVLEIGLKGTINVIELSRRFNVKTFVFISSSEVYQTPPVLPTPEEVRLIVPDVLNPRYSYGGGKIVGELLTVNAFRNSEKTRWIIIRPHNIYGPDMGFEHVIPEIIRKIMIVTKKLREKEGIIEIKGTGEETRAFCYIKDFIQGLKILLRKASSGIYNIGTDDEISIKNLVNRIAKILGVKIQIKSSEAMPGSPSRRCPDITKIRNLGYIPQWPLDKGLEETVKWYIDYFLKEGI